MGSFRSYISLSSLALLVFAGVTLFLFHGMAGILDLKFLQIKQAVERERIMNLELSSRALRSRMDRIRQENAGLKRELRQNLLESRVLNTSSEELDQSDDLPIAALVVTNAVRLLTLKEPLQLEADHEKLMALKLAFYFERSRKYDEALRIYSRLNPQDFPDPFPAFLGLHMGFCTLALGKWEKAQLHLESVIQNYPATHFGRAARFLLELLENQKRAELETGADLIEQADMLFEAGNCPATVQTLNRLRKQGPLSTFHLYRLGLCLEETGEVDQATVIFQKLAASPGPYATEANRRLLMIGYFYGGGKQVRKDAETRAIRQGDSQTLKEVIQTSSETRKPRVVEEIKEWNKQSSQDQGILRDVLNDPDPSMQRELEALDLNQSAGVDGSETLDQSEIEESSRDSAEPEVVADPDDRPEPDQRKEEIRMGRLEALMAAGDSRNSDQYEISRPGVQRWPATLKSDGKLVRILLLTQRTRGVFESADGTQFSLSEWNLAAHPSGHLLVRLRDNRSFLVKEARIRDGMLLSGSFNISLDLVYQIAAY